jgi:hypothetical protein
MSMSSKWHRNLAFTLGLAIPLAAAFAPTGKAAPHTTLVVAPSKAVCPNATFTSIQDAVNAASPGDEIRICAGTYVEQVKITKSLDIDADDGAILMPSAMTANTNSLFDSSPIAAALVVLDATGVSITNLTVDGANNGITECSPDLIGITYQNASGTISRVAVRNFQLGADNGCQSGTGIFVESGGGGASNVEISHSTVHDFQKNGITADEAGSVAIIKHNVVTGIGPTNAIAQNGVQIGFGAAGSIIDNVVTNTVYAQCTSVATCNAVATNILVFDSDGVEVSRNTAGIGQINVGITGNNATVNGNQTFDAIAFDGINIQGNGSTVTQNHVFNGAQAGVSLAGNTNTITDNTITEAAVGILQNTGSTGNIITANHFFDTPIAVQDPISVNVAKLVQPKR